MFKKLREKTNLYYIKKYDGGGPLTDPSGSYRIEIGQDGKEYHNPNGVWELRPDVNVDGIILTLSPALTAMNNTLTQEVDQSANSVSSAGTDAHYLEQQELNLRKQERLERRAERLERRAEKWEAWEDANQGKAEGTISSAITNGVQGNWGAMAADLGVAAMKSIDLVAMGDKNFGAQSEAIDSAVHGVSSALMKSGNPYAMAAGAALEGANFLTKAGGQTVQGFDVDINSSGYGDLGHMESSSSRDFGAMIGLGGIFGQKKLQRKLQKRNEQALMAMNAANIAEDLSFEQEARMNSIQNTIMNNQMALAGGLDTSLLGG